MYGTRPLAKQVCVHTTHTGVSKRSATFSLTILVLLAYMSALNFFTD